MMPRVLVVDDDQSYLEAAAVLLAQDERIEVVGCACDGREAVERAAALEPDVVLMDVEMPVLDGLEATRRLRRLMPATLIVIVTASDSADTRRQAREAGAHAVLPKSLAEAVLAEAVVSAGCEVHAR
jgi:DNA-binding NarL/FixJ family response regulator